MAVLYSIATKLGIPGYESMMMLNDALLRPTNVRNGFYLTALSRNGMRLTLFMQA